MQESSSKSLPLKRLYSLDAARGVASLIVVLQHWPQHFGLVPGHEFTASDLPLFDFLSPFYLSGARAVGFFFVLSGFIFYWLYSESIHRRQTGVWQFFVLRFSRLYPLHLTTLLLCVGLQIQVRPLLGEDFIYHWNDGKHMVLNLLFAQHWGIQSGYSWNGPSWSISVEIAIYGIFFATCRLFRPVFAHSICFMIVMWALAGFSPVASNAVSFFAGGLTFWICRYLAPRWTVSRQGFLLIVLAVAWLTIPPHLAKESIDSLHQTLSALTGPEGPARLIPLGIKLIMQRGYDLILFPVTILALALGECAFKSSRWQVLHGFGNLSYGIYLLHFPLQLTFVSVVLAVGGQPGILTSSWIMVFFFALLVTLAALSYRFLERPLMGSARKQWL